LSSAQKDGGVNVQLIRLKKEAALFIVCIAPLIFPDANDDGRLEDVIAYTSISEFDVQVTDEVMELDEDNESIA